MVGWKNLRRNLQHSNKKTQKYLPHYSKSAHQFSDKVFVTAARGQDTYFFAFKIGEGADIHTGRDIMVQLLDKGTSDDLCGQPFGKGFDKWWQPNFPDVHTAGPHSLHQFRAAVKNLYFRIYAPFLEYTHVPAEKERQALDPARWRAPGYANNGIPVHRHREKIRG